MSGSKATATAIVVMRERISMQLLIDEADGDEVELGKVAILAPILILTFSELI